MESSSRAAARALPVLIGAALLALVAVVVFQGKRVLEDSPPLAVDLHAFGDKGIETQVPLGTALLLHLDLAGLPVPGSYAVEVDDASGVQVLQEGVGAQELQATVKVPSVPPGLYFVRVTAPSGELLREYGFRVMHHH
jgi:hypothetical protein